MIPTKVVSFIEHKSDSVRDQKNSHREPCDRWKRNHSQQDLPFLSYILSILSKFHAFRLLLVTWVAEQIVN